MNLILGFTFFAHGGGQTEGLQGGGVTSYTYNCSDLISHDDSSQEVGGHDEDDFGHENDSGHDDTDFGHEDDSGHDDTDSGHEDDLEFDILLIFFCV